MFVYRDVISKSGKAYIALYYQFKSGKRYRLTLPWLITKKIVESGFIEVVKDNGTGI